jgi:hypothetical protein
MSMKKLLYSHPNIIIGTLAVVLVGTLLVGTLIFFYSWAIDDMFSQIPRALIPPASQSITGFDLSAASKLDLRGLVNEAPSPAPAPAPVSVPAVAPSLPASPSSSATGTSTP